MLTYFFKVQLFDHILYHRLHITGEKKRSNVDYKQQFFITLYDWQNVQITINEMCL